MVKLYRTSVLCEKECANMITYEDICEITEAIHQHQEAMEYTFTSCDVLCLTPTEFYMFLHSLKAAISYFKAALDGKEKGITHPEVMGCMEQIEPLSLVLSQIEKYTHLVSFSALYDFTGDGAQYLLDDGSTVFDRYLVPMPNNWKEEFSLSIIKGSSILMRESLMEMIGIGGDLYDETNGK